MVPAWRPARYLPLALLVACGGQPLRQITPVEGSRTREGGTILPIDSTHPREIRPLAPGTASGASADSSRVIRPLHGAPAAGREIAPLDTVVVPLDGTTWSGSNHEGSITFEFLIGGILRYTTPNGTWTNGTWRQQGNSVTFAMNDGYAEYTGRISGTRMSGTGQNRTGARWEWRADRQ